MFEILWDVCVGWVVEYCWCVVECCWVFEDVVDCWGIGYVV